jgi:hypothetical protein
MVRIRLSEKLGLEDLRLNAGNHPVDDFISEDDLLVFEGFLKYQSVDAVTLTAEELEIWKGFFDQAIERRKTSPKVGLMKLQPVPGEQKYAVAIRDGSDLWLTLWVRCSRKGEVFIMYPRGDRDWNAHASYHLDGTFHQKSYGDTWGIRQKCQPLTAAFKGSEHLGVYAGHGAKSVGAIYDPGAFTGAVIVEPVILGPRHGTVAVEMAEPGFEPKPTPGIHQRQVFPRDSRPSIVITIGGAP